MFFKGVASRSSSGVSIGLVGGYMLVQYWVWLCVGLGFGCHPPTGLQYTKQYTILLFFFFFFSKCERPYYDPVSSTGIGTHLSYQTRITTRSNEQRIEA